MAKRGKLKSYARIKGKGEPCPKCNQPMQRRERIKPPVNRNYFYTEWDYCLPCAAIYQYEEFKSEEWQEDERQQNFLNQI